MKNLLVVLAATTLFSTVSMAAGMSFTCTDSTGTPVQLTVASPKLVTVETNFAKGGLQLTQINSNQTFGKFVGYMGGKESKGEFPATVLVSTALLNCQAIPHGFSIGSIIIQGTGGQPQTFNCR